MPRLPSSRLSAFRGSTFRGSTLLYFLVGFLVASIGGASCGGEAPAARDDDDARPSATDAGDAGDDSSSPPPAKPVGAPCSGPAECVEGASCIGTRDERYVCMADCETPYDICPDGSLCLPVSNGAAAICYTGGDVAPETTCRSNLDCASGHLCVGAGTSFFCLRACHGSGETCTSDEFCSSLETGAGVCRPLLGTTCAVDADCEGPSLGCTREADPGYEPYLPGGYCSRIGCVDDSECPGDSPCRSVPGVEAPVCLLACDSDADCRFNAGYRCVDRSACDAWPDPEACRALMGDDRLCVVPNP